MGELFRRKAVTVAVTALGSSVAWSTAFAQSALPTADPPSRVGRLAFTQGTVSFHDPQQKDWTQALANTPITTGDSVWTEPNAHSEISLAGTRLRLDGATQLDMLAVDDSQTRLQLDEGRLDIKTFDFDGQQPYQIATPRGTVSLLQQGDYYVEAGSTQDATRLGVRAGAAQIQSLNGQVVAVRPGEVAEISGDAATPQLRTLSTAPPAPPAYWQQRDRQISYNPPQYVPVDMTGYEDLNAYGSWTTDPTYGQVWTPGSVPAGWEPYRTGRWDYVQPWGWTWVDEQPWGFAPYHYGRWAHANNRWMWVPPEHGSHSVYAPALVAFMGGAALASALRSPTSAPIGWFPLGPREAYVPPYSKDLNYYHRINQPARVEQRALDERWQQTERREAADPQHTPTGLMNQRFATVVPTSTFTRSQPVAHANLQTTPEKIATTPVAAQAAIEAKPAAVERPSAPGPKFAATTPHVATESGRPNLPALSPRQGTAPPELKGTATPVAPQAIAKPAEPTGPQHAQPQAAPPVPPPAAQARPVEPPHVEATHAEPGHAQQAPQQQATPPAAAQQHAPAEQHQAEQPHQPEQQQPQAPAAAPAVRPHEMQEGARQQPVQPPQQAHSEPQPQQQHAAPQVQPQQQPHPQPQQQAAQPHPQPHAAPQPAPNHQEQAQEPEHKK
jgi:hypothetical protein